MLITESLNNAQWLAEVKAGIEHKVAHLVYGRSITFSAGGHAYKLTPWLDFKVSMELFDYPGDSQMLLYWQNGYKTLNHECIFQFDSLGISLFVDVLIDKRPRYKKYIREAIILADNMYREKHRGNVAGNKFGF